MLEIRNLCKNYKMGSNTIKALCDINLKIDDGEFVGILGNSGSGKSTLVNIIAGLTKPTSGEVLINDALISKMNDRQISKYRNKTLGFVFQSFNLLPDLTALDNVMLPLAYSKIPYKTRINMALFALEKVGLSDRVYHKPSELSGGQMQRVSIARSIVNSPKIIIADEPTGNLDEKSADNIMNILMDINKNGVTVIMVTHNLEYRKFFTEIVNIKDGRIQIDDSET